MNLFVTQRESQKLRKIQMEYKIQEQNHNLRAHCPPLGLLLLLLLLPLLLLIHLLILGVTACASYHLSLLLCFFCRQICLQCTVQKDTNVCSCVKVPLPSLHCPTLTVHWVHCAFSSSVHFPVFIIHTVFTSPPTASLLLLFPSSMKLDHLL